MQEGNHFAPPGYGLCSTVDFFPLRAVAEDARWLILHAPLRAERSC